MTLILHEHAFASYCWKVLIALYEREVPFTRVHVGDAEDRARLAELWPMGSIPVLVDTAHNITLPESTAIIEHLDGIGDAPALVPADRAAAVQARLWDRILDGHVMTPMQKIVGDELRAAGQRDRAGVAEARDHLDRAYALLDDHLTRRTWLTDEAFTLAECAAAPALFYADVVHPWGRAERPSLTAYAQALFHRDAVARVIEEARPFRPLLPLPWPEHVT